MEVTLSAAARKSHPRGVWLRQSLAWTLACGIGWLVASSWLDNVLAADGAAGKVLLLGTAGVAHGLIWYKAFLSSPAATDAPEPLWLTAASAFWTFGLLLFQVLCLLLWFLALLLACDTSSVSWN